MSGPASIHPDRVAMYIRWSTDDQGEGTTLEVQQEACAAYIRSQGWRVNPRLVFVDDGHSGSHLRRPALDRLRQAVRAGEVDCVIVFKLDRLSRSVVDTVNLVLAEWEGRCHLKSAREPIDTATPAGKMFFYLLASYAEWERNVIRERTSAGRLQRAREGRWASGPRPYGYRVDADRRLVPDPAEAAVVRAIFQGYLKGRTVADLVRELKAGAAPAPAGPGRWSKSLVRRILGNPLYAGIYEYGRWRVNPRHGRDGEAPRLVRAGASHVRLPGSVPALVPEADFRRVQELKAARDPRRSRSSGRAYSSRWLLSGVARCGRCGASLGARGPRNGRAAYYFCLGRAGKLDCDCAQIPVAQLDRWLVGELKQLYGDAVRRGQALESLRADHRQRRAELAAAMAAVRTRLAQLDREREVIRRRFRAGEITGGEYRQFMAEIAAEADHMRQRLAGLEAEAEALNAPAAALEALAARVAALDVFEVLDPRDRKRLVLRLVESLRVYRAPGSREVTATVVWRVNGGAGCAPAETPGPDTGSAPAAGRS